MDILVFVKQVPDDSVEIHLDGAGVPAVKDVEKITNAFDTCIFLPISASLYPFPSSICISNAFKHCN